MTTLYLFRHGQASAGSANYDVLSPKGRKQSAVLGQHLKTTGHAFDAVYSGDLKRQIDTATIALNIDHTNVSQNSDFNEYNHHEIFSHYLPRLAKTDNAVAKAATAGPHTIMTQAIFNKLMAAWASDPEHQGIESWNEFNTRVARGIDNIARNHGEKTNVAIFTSGGVISTILHTILDFPVENVFNLNWQINNASISCITYRQNRFNLREYNNVTHLILQKDSSLITQI